MSNVGPARPRSLFAERHIAKGYKVSLIRQIHRACESDDLPLPFTVEHLKSWMKANNIVKDDGTKYAAASIEAILSNSDRKNTPTSNRNVKPLQSRINQDGKYEYWF
jgi:hypothetical protein